MEDKKNGYKYKTGDKYCKFMLGGETCQSFLQ